MKLLPCPFCGLESDTDWEDTLYPSGSYWAVHSSGFRFYFSRRTYPDDKMPEPEGRVYNIVCSENYGGCGTEIAGDSKEEAIKKWQTRA